MLGRRRFLASTPDRSVQEDKLMQQIRYLDRLVDELAKGKAIDKILRK
jgi:hypothetical protein